MLTTVGLPEPVGCAWCCAGPGICPQGARALGGETHGQLEHYVAGPAPTFWSKEEGAMFSVWPHSQGKEKRGGNLDRGGAERQGKPEAGGGKNENGPMVKTAEHFLTKCLKQWCLPPAPPSFFPKTPDPSYHPARRGTAPWPKSF